MRASQGAVAARSGKTRQKQPKSRQRLSPEDRERMIVRGAVSYFAANGFDGDTRALAKSLGVSQALIFHYFPPKDALIDRVYEDVFLSRWKTEWEELLSDRDRSLRRRLKDFYRDYYHTANQYEWIRITLYSALRDIDINARYHSRVRTRVIHRIIRELRDELNLGREDAPITDEEEHLIYNLHAAVIYQLIRNHIYKMPSTANMDRIINAHVDLFMDSAPLVLHRLLSDAAASRAAETVPPPEE